MENFLNNEKIICSINCYKNVIKSDELANIAVNLVTGGVAGRVLSDFKLILTQEKLYIQTIEYAAWGGLSEVLYTDKIIREDIKSFKVEIKDNKEFIKITTMDNKAIDFIRDNEKNDDLALIMASIIDK